jgi:hypothetical protein
MVIEVSTIRIQVGTDFPMGMKPAFIALFWYVTMPTLSSVSTRDPRPTLRFLIWPVQRCSAGFARVLVGGAVGGAHRLELVGLCFCELPIVAGFSDWLAVTSKRQPPSHQSTHSHKQAIRESDFTD